ncbi:MAG: helix-turn-helix transcriptional regulator [Desulfotignum sp.]|nr:helix-turn-helix transcriptional regulator [Desulfotignum sp.]
MNFFYSGVHAEPAFTQNVMPSFQGLSYSYGYFNHNHGIKQDSKMIGMGMGGRTRKEFAKILGITPASLCDFERGPRIPSIKRAAGITRSIGTCAADAPKGFS